MLPLIVQHSEALTSFIFALQPALYQPQIRRSVADRRRFDRMQSAQDAQRPGTLAPACRRSQSAGRFLSGKSLEHRPDQSAAQEIHAC
jgi:hypothetical protein